MSRIRLYVDEDAAEKAVVDGLRDRGVDVLTVIDAGMAGATDEEQLELAASLGRCLYTLNVDDFCRLHGEYLSSAKDHAGIVVIPRQRYAIGEKIHRLIDLMDSLTAEEMTNRLEFL